MNAISKTIEDAIAKRLAEMTAIADAGRAEDAEIDAIMKWQTVPAQVTDEQLAMIVIMAQSNQGVAQMMNQDVLKAVFETVQEIAEKDQVRFQSILEKAGEFQNKERLQPGISLQVVAGGLEAAAVLVTVDQDLNVALTDKLDSDLYLGVYSSPRGNRSLTDQFNVGMTYTAAGQPLKPVSVTGVVAGAATIHVCGHMQAADGRMQPIAAIVPVNVAAGPASTRNPGAPQPQ